MTMRKNSRYLMAAGALIVLTAAVLCLVASPAGAASGKNQTTDQDLLAGQLGDVVVKGSGPDAFLEVARSDTWVKRAASDRPTPRIYPGLATIYNDDKILLFGGHDGSKWCQDTWIYDMSDARWYAKSPPTSPPAITSPSPAGILNDDKVVMLAYVPPAMQTWVYDLSDNNWVRKGLADSPPGRYDYALSAVPGDDKALLFGGDRNLVSEGFETWPFPPANGWSTSGNANWFQDWTIRYEGYYSGASGTITHSQSSSLSLVVDIPGDSVIYFYWSVSSEGYYDSLIFSVDSVEQSRISGSVGWTYKSCFVKAGLHTLTWKYQKDGSISSGSDRGWVDYVRIDTVYADTWLYDVSENAWVQSKPSAAPSSRYGMALAPSEGDDKVVLFGGINLTCALCETWVYDVGDQQWSRKSSLPSFSGALPTLTSFGLDDKVMLFNRASTTSMWMYDIGDDKWTDRSATGRPQLMYFGAAGLYHQDRILFFGGTDASYRDDIYMFRPYMARGSFISQPLDLGGRSAFLDLNWTAVTSAEKGVKLQFRSAASRDSLASKSFCGPDGSANSFYTSNPAALWRGHDGNSWVQFSAYLDTCNTDVSPALKDVSFTYNRIPEAPLPAGPGDGSWTTNAVPVFTWAFRDADSTVQGAFQWQSSRSAMFDAVDIDSGWTASASTSYLPARLPDGMWHWRVRTRDPDGNLSDWGTVWKIGIDTTPPSTTGNPPSGWVRGQSRVELSATDGGIGVRATFVRVDNGNWAQDTAANVSGDGIHTVYYYSVDLLGNSEAVITATIKIDGQSPVSGALALPRYSTSRLITVHFSASDATSGLQPVSLFVRAGGAGSFTEAGKYIFSPATYIASADGLYEFYTVASDVAGNAEAAPAEARCNTTVDTAAPATAADPPGGWVRSSVDLALSASDGIGLDRTMYRLDTGDWIAYSAPISVVGDGTHEIVYYSVDLAGNTEAMKRAVIRIDATPPVSSMAPLQKYQTSRDFYLFFNGSDGGSGLDGIEIWYRQGQGAFQQLAGRFTLSPVFFQAAQDGVCEFYTVSRDLAGNVEATPAAAQARTTVDTSTPVPSVNLAERVSTQKSSILLNGTVEPGSKVHVNDVAVPVDAQGAFSLRLRLLEGPNSFRIVSVDPAGNVQTVTRTVEKTTPPPSFLDQNLPWILMIVMLCVFLVITLIALFRRPRQPAAASPTATPPPSYYQPPPQPQPPSPTGPQPGGPAPGQPQMLLPPPPT